MMVKAQRRGSGYREPRSFHSRAEAFASDDVLGAICERDPEQFLLSRVEMTADSIKGSDYRLELIRDIAQRLRRNGRISL